MGIPLFYRILCSACSLCFSICGVLAPPAAYVRRAYSSQLRIDRGNKADIVVVAISTRGGAKVRGYPCIWGCGLFASGHQRRKEEVPRITGNGVLVNLGFRTYVLGSRYNSKKPSFIPSLLSPPLLFCSVHFLKRPLLLASSS